MWGTLYVCWLLDLKIFSAFKWMWYNNFYIWLENGHSVTDIAHCEHRFMQMLRTTFKFQLRNSFFFFREYAFNFCHTMSQASQNSQKLLLWWGRRYCYAAWCEKRNKKRKKDKKTQNLKYSFYNFILTSYWHYMVQQQQTVHHVAALHNNIYSYPQAAATAASSCLVNNFYHFVTYLE